MSRATARVSQCALALLVLVASFAVLSLTASAHSQKVRDRSGDAKFGSKAGDIRRVILRHKKGARLSFAIKVGARDRYGSLYQGILIKVGKRRYDIQGVAKKVSITVWEDETPSQTGFKARFQERGKWTTYTFSERAIGSPRSFRWQAWTAGADPPVIDRAPNKGWVWHRMRGRSSVASAGSPFLTDPKPLGDAIRG